MSDIVAALLAAKELVRDAAWWAADAEIPAADPFADVRKPDPEPRAFFPWGPNVTEDDL